MTPRPLVAVVMGSSSDLHVMQGAADVLAHFRIAHEVKVVSAHRTPDDMLAFGHAAAGRGLQVIVAGAGGAAHLPGMLASVTTVPVVGVPVALDRLDGLDSLLSMVQMPRGVPVATVAVNGAANAGLLAARSSRCRTPLWPRPWPTTGRAGRPGPGPGRGAGPARLSAGLRGATVRSMPTLAERLGYPADARLLIINADDLGFCHSANVGVFDCLTTGLVTSATLMVPCPWAREAAARYRGEDVGVHLTVNAE